MDTTTDDGLSLPALDQYHIMCNMCTVEQPHQGASNVTLYKNSAVITFTVLCLHPGNTFVEVSKLIGTGTDPLSISDGGWMTRGLCVDGTQDGRAGLVVGVAKSD